MKFKRKRKCKTDYKKRLSLLKSGKVRLVVRKTNKNIIVQFVSYHPDGDKVLCSAHTNELKRHGWNGARRNLPAGYLAGLLAGVKAKDVKGAILDIGFVPPIKGSLIYAVLKGVLDAGVEVPHSDDIFPDEKRLKGEHIASNDKTKFTKFDSKKAVQNFEDTKKKILGVKNGK